jgi:hypothetical protein
MRWNDSERSRVELQTSTTSLAQTRTFGKDELFTKSLHSLPKKKRIPVFQA